MKRTLTFFALAIGIVATAVSCDKGPKTEIQEPLKLVIRANSPETRTSITDNGNGSYSPSWSAGDAIGVYFTNVEGGATEFVNDNAGSTALFEHDGEITSVSGDQTLYAFYPLSAFDAVSKSEKSIRLNVKDSQTPNSVGTFDKATDLLVARPYSGNITTINTDGGIIDLAFARILSVVKVTPSDGTTGSILDGEYVKSVKIEYDGSGDDDPLTGRVTLNLNSGELGEWTIKTYSVSAGYGDGVFALNGTNAAFLLVNPATISSGKSVTFTVKTDKHDISKSFNLGDDLVFPAGNIATIGLNITDSWTIEDNTLDPNIIFKAPFTADISSDTSYEEATHGVLGVVGTSASSITYTFAGTKQLRNNGNKISADDASFYWCTSSTGLTIGGINTGSNQYFNLSFYRKVPSSTATLAISISEDGIHFFPITSDETVSLGTTDVLEESFNFSIPSGEHTNLHLRFENSGSGVSIDNVTLTKLAAAGIGNNAVSFEVPAVDPTLSVSPDPVNIAVGNTQQLTVTGTDGAISYVSDDPSVATVSSDGLVTAVATGSTSISISSAATVDYNAGATSVTVNVVASLTEGAAWSYPFTAIVWDSEGAKTINSKSWTMSGTGGPYFGFDDTKGQQFGSAGKPYSALSLSSDFGGDYGVRKVRVSTSGAGGIAATVSVSVGGVAFECADETSVSITSTNASYTFETPDGNLKGGSIAITYANSSSKAIYVKKIWVNPGPPTQLTMSDISCTAHTATSLTFGWSAVDGAIGYQISTNGTDYGDTQAELSYTRTGLEASNNYTIWVKAIGDGDDYTTSAPKQSAVGTTDSAGGGKINQVLFHETFGNNTGSVRDWNDSYSVKTGVSAVYSGVTAYTVSNAGQGKNTTGSTQSGLNQRTQGTDAYIIIGPLAVSNAENMVLTYQWKAGSIGKTYYTKLYYATSSGGDYTEVSGTGAGATTFVERTYSLPVAAQVNTLYLKIVWNTSNTQAIIDEVNLQGDY